MLAKKNYFFEKCILGKNIMSPRKRNFCKSNGSPQTQSEHQNSQTSRKNATIAIFWGAAKRMASGHFLSQESKY